MNKSGIIRKAAENLPGRWYQGALNYNGNRCGLGHVVFACSLWQETLFTTDNAYIMMNRTAREMFPDRVSAKSHTADFVEFNDHPRTTESEVVSVLEKVAVQLEEHDE